MRRCCCPRECWRSGSAEIPGLGSTSYAVWLLIVWETPDSYRTSVWRVRMVPGSTTRSEGWCGHTSTLRPWRGELVGPESGACSIPTLSAYVGYQPPELVEEGVVSRNVKGPFILAPYHTSVNWWRHEWSRVSWGSETLNYCPGKCGERDQDFPDKKAAGKLAHCTVSERQRCSCFRSIPLLCSSQNLADH